MCQRPSTCSATSSTARHSVSTGWILITIFAAAHVFWPACLSVPLSFFTLSLGGASLISFTRASNGASLAMCRGEREREREMFSTARYRVVVAAVSARLATLRETRFTPGEDKALPPRQTEIHTRIRVNNTRLYCARRDSILYERSLSQALRREGERESFLHFTAPQDMLYVCSFCILLREQLVLGYIVVLVVVTAKCWPHLAAVAV